MSATTSATTGRRYGVKRVCRTWKRSRSALYAPRASVQRSRSHNCWRPFALTCPAHRSRAKATVRSTRGCGSSMGSGCPGRGCYG